MQAMEAVETMCLECGGDVWPERERSYLLDGDAALCYVCARRRGGIYDELGDRWTVCPELSGLLLL